MISCFPILGVCNYIHLPEIGVFMIKNCELCNGEFEPKSKKVRFCSKKCVAKNFSNTFRHSEESKQKMSRDRVGRPSWNKGRTAKDDPRILSGDKHPAKNNPMVTKATHPGWAVKIKNSCKGKINLGDSNGMRKPEVRKRVSETRKKSFKKIRNSSRRYQKELAELGLKANLMV